MTAYFGVEADIVTVSAPVPVPSNASNPIDHSFPGYAFEESSFPAFTGSKENPNIFSQNLLKAISDKTGAPAHIRVGGTSLDRSSYNSTQTEPVKGPPGQENKGIPKNIALGPSYFDLFSNFPNAKYTIDIPFAKENLSNSISFVKGAQNAINQSSIYAWEIGNEVNNYPGNVRPPGWSESDYATQWGTWSSNISSDALGLPDMDENHSRIYQAVALSSGTGANNGFPGGGKGFWNISEIFKDGLDQYEGRIKTVSMHYYQTKAKPDSSLQHDLMNHSAITQGSTFIHIAIKYIQSQSPPIPLVLGEVGSALGNKTFASIDRVFGTALWQVDFYLYCMSIGVAGINYQSGLNLTFSLWSPGQTSTINTPKTVYPGFYAQLFTADFISTNTSNNNLSITNIDLQNDYLSAYAAYSNKRLSRIAIINLNLWPSTSESQTSSSSAASAASSVETKRPSQNITIPFDDEEEEDMDVKSVMIRRLTSPIGRSAGDARNITWGGMQWTGETNGIGMLVLNDTETVQVVDKKVDFEVKASEAVMVSIEY